MNIDGLGEKLIDKFIKLNLIKKKLDIYDLEKYKDKIVNLDGFGEKSFNNIIESINRSKSTSLSKFLFALGLRYLGENNYDLISRNIRDKKSFKNFIQSIDLKEQLKNIDGLGDKVISFIDYFLDKDNLKEHYIRYFKN